MQTNGSTESTGTNRELKRLADEVTTVIYQPQSFQKLREWITQSQPDQIPQALATAVVATVKKVAGGELPIDMAYAVIMTVVARLVQDFAASGQVEFSEEMLKQLQVEIGNAWDGDVPQNPSPQGQPQASPGQPQPQPVGPQGM